MLPGKDDLLSRLMQQATGEKPEAKTEEPKAKEPEPEKVKEPEPKTEEPKPKAKKSKPAIKTLYVDCLPNHEVFDASMIFTEVSKRLREATQVPHYKMIDFGKGPGVFSEAVREYVEANCTDAEMFLDSRSLEGSDALTVLNALASKVVRGVR